MKKITLTLLASIFALASFAQKYAYVDTDYILKNIPEYIAAQKTIDDLSEKYQKELEAKKAMINKKISAIPS
ncbi:OmpH family outer membrane protein [Flavobacteriales bacterium]|nr:OmpH family outer membrane protein [Flavobacteriales bacterium]